MKFLLASLWVIIVCRSASAENIPLHKLERVEQEQRIESDLKLVTIYRAGLSNLVEFARTQTNLFPTAKPDAPTMPRREDKVVLWQIWKSYLDYLMALDALDSYHSADWLLLSGQREDKSFAVAYAAFLAKYRFSLDFVALVERNPMLDTILNEPVPELDLPAGTYAKLKLRFLHIVAASDFAAQAVLFKTKQKAVPDTFRAAMASDETVILKMGRGQGELLTAEHALKILKNAGHAAWFPVQAGVSEWMGDAKVHRTDHSLITAAQIENLRQKLEPGDVLLARREWFLSNVGLPGFWPHAALYVGTPEERKTYFSDAEVASWIKSLGEADGDFERLIQSRSITNYTKSLKPHPHGQQTRVIEAMSEGVSFTALEHCADADSLVALRPLLPKAEKAKAILRAFHYAGRPYDFDFDFATDSQLVCTELVYKSYEPAKDMKGLHLPLEEMLGRPLLPANGIARQFDEQCGTANQQFQFIEFLDGHEREGKAVEASLDVFRNSWRRPKWHIITQPAAN